MRQYIYIYKTIIVVVLVLTLMTVCNSIVYRPAIVSCNNNKSFIYLVL